MRKFLVSLVLGASVLLSGCLTRIESGEIGVRVDASKQIQGAELQPGSWNQTLVGNVLTFPVKDIAISIENKQPMTSDNTALSDFDLTVVYAINPSSVAELYTQKSKSFHMIENDGDTVLMYGYMQTLVNNASYKAIREYPSLGVADKREELEVKIRQYVTEQLKQEKLDTSISLNVVQIRSILPNQAILDSATAYVKSMNEIKVKENEVRLAKLESERMSALANNSTQSIAYMQAQSQLLIAQAVAGGKVQTIIIPHNMTALGTIK